MSEVVPETAQHVSAEAEESEPRARWAAHLASWRTLGIVIPFVALFITLSIASGPFLTKINLVNILGQQSAALIIGAGSTLVLIAGGIDLSVGATYGLASVVAGQVDQHNPAGLALVVALGLGAVIGAVNGVVSTVFKMNSLIATLAMSFIVTGTAEKITGGNLVDITDQGFKDIAYTKFLTVPTSVWIALIVVVVLGVFLSRSVPGRYIFASGGSSEAARLAGVPVNGTRIMAFVISGVCAALGGCIDTARIFTAQATQGGSTLTFTVLAGVVVGGTSILGGEGAIWRTVVGVLFIALIGNGFDLLSIDPLVQQIILGAILMLAVGLDAVTRRRT
jgi:ribose transport system permease protein